MEADYPLSFAPDHRAPEHPAPDALVFAFHERKLLVTEMMEVPTFRQSVLSGCEFVRTQFLGQHGHTPCYSAQLDPRTAQAPGMLAMDLRSLYGKLNPEHHAIAGRGVQIAEWDRTHQFCGACGCDCPIEQGPLSQLSPVSNPDVSPTGAGDDRRGRERQRNSVSPFSSLSTGDFQRPRRLH